MITGCGGDEPSTPSTPTTPPATSDSTQPPSVRPTFDRNGCPVTDPGACALAVEVATALVLSDAGHLTALSRTSEFVCDEVADLPLPACTPGAVLTGHPLIDSQPVIEVLDSAAYAAHNETVLGNVDPSFVDEHGDGAVRVIGVGTCGPDVPERRSYHVAYTAGVNDGSDVERLVGSYELNLLDGEWLIGTAFLDSYDAWLDAYQDPLREHGCAPVPWG